MNAILGGLAASARAVRETVAFGDAVGLKRTSGHSDTRQHWSRAGEPVFRNAEVGQLSESVERRERASESISSD